MKIFPSKFSSDENLVAFEIENIYASRSQILKILSSIPNVDNIQPRNLLTNNDDILIRFEFKDIPFLVWEPYGDNSRYWIGPEDPSTFKDDISSIADAFRLHIPSMVRRIAGYILHKFFTS